jgi:hypothetical protein
MTTNDLTTEIAALLDEWGIDYTATSSSIYHGGVTLSIASNKGTPTVEITDGDTLLAITSSADKAAALLAFPLARRAWDAGYCGDFEIDVLDGFLDMRLSYRGDSVTLSGDVEASSEFTVAEHPLFREQITMSDLSAVLESAELAYGNPDEAWQVLCSATDFEQDDWMVLVERCLWRARFDCGERLTKVSTSESDSVALVDGYDPELPIRVFDVDASRDGAYWSPQEVAAAVLAIIA